MPFYFPFHVLNNHFFHSILVLYILQKRSLDTFYSNSNNIGFLHVFLWQTLFDLIIHFLVWNCFHFIHKTGSEYLKYTLSKYPEIHFLHLPVHTQPNNYSKQRPLNTLRPRQMAAIFQTTFWNGFSWMKMFEYRLKFHWSFFPGGPINNIPTLVQVMAWRRPGDKPLSEPMMVRLPTHICVTRTQWVNWVLFCSYVVSNKKNVCYIFLLDLENSAGLYQIWWPSILFIRSL